MIADRLFLVDYPGCRTNSDPCQVDRCMWKVGQRLRAVPANCAGYEKRRNKQVGEDRRVGEKASDRPLLGVYQAKSY